MAGGPRRSGPAGPLTAAADGVRLAVHVTPRSGRNRIGGVGPGADGRPRLRVAVTAPPEDGKANAAVIALLARAWRMPKRAFSVKTGAAAREKLLHIAGEAETLLPALAERIGTTDV